MNYRDFTRDERNEWLHHPLTVAFLAEIETMKTDYLVSAARGAANAQSESIVRSTAGGYVALERALTTARDL